MFFDIGANLTDSQFQGIYRNRVLHEPDLDKLALTPSGNEPNDNHSYGLCSVLKRASEEGVRKIIITAGTLAEVHKALKICDQYDTNGGFLYTSVGIHPTNCHDMEDHKEEYLDELIQLAKKRVDRVICVGELGLDFDRTHFCDRETQIKGFQLQLQRFTSALNLPFFLHMRNAFPEFREILGPFCRGHKAIKGVVHSFTGTAAEAQEILKMGLHIGLNGCSLKDEKSLQVVRSLPLNCIHFETDAPWCSIRPTSAFWHLCPFSSRYQEKKAQAWEKDSCVKGRNEPWTIRHVAEIVCHMKSENVQTHKEIIEKVFSNSLKLFLPSEVSDDSL